MKRPAARRGAARASSIWTLAALDLVGAFGCMLAALAPVTVDELRRTLAGAAVAFLLMAVVIWLAAPLARRWCEPIGAVLTLGVISFLAAHAATEQGAVIVCFTYVWIAVYAASFLSRRICYVLLALIAAGAAGGLAANGAAHWEGVWVLIVLTTSVTGVVLERSVGQLRREAETDALTGLLNRRGLAKAAELERSLSARAGFRLAVAVIDLDNFKTVNDVEGHAAGDTALADAAAAWRASLRDGDLLARRGGDEFAAIFPVQDELDANAALVRLRAAHPIPWTAGVVLLSEGESLEGAIARADDRLYQAKLRERGAELSSWVMG